MKFAIQLWELLWTVWNVFCLNVLTKLCKRREDCTLWRIDNELIREYEIGNYLYEDQKVRRPLLSQSSVKLKIKKNCHYVPYRLR